MVTTINNSDYLITTYPSQSLGVFSRQLSLLFEGKNTVVFTSKNRCSLQLHNFQSQKKRIDYHYYRHLKAKELYKPFSLNPDILMYLKQRIGDPRNLVYSIILLMPFFLGVEKEGEKRRRVEGRKGRREKERKTERETT